jgi:hypothetical protein
VLRGVLREVEVVGVDLVEVAPAYDSAEITAMAAAEVVFEVLSGVVKRGLGWGREDRCLGRVRAMHGRCTRRLAASSPNPATAPRLRDS